MRQLLFVVMKIGPTLMPIYCDVKCLKKRFYLYAHIFVLNSSGQSTTHRCANASTFALSQPAKTASLLRFEVDWKPDCYAL
jgi:hypothetical protein